MPAFTKDRRSVRASELRKSEQLRAGMRAFRREKSAGGNASERLHGEYPAFTSNASPQFTRCTVRFLTRALVPASRWSILGGLDRSLTVVRLSVHLTCFCPINVYNWFRYRICPDRGRKRNRHSHRVGPLALRPNCACGA